MSLIKCKECNNEVSNKAKTCPNCGAKITKGMGCLTLIGYGIIGIIGISVIGAIFGNHDKPKTNNSQLEAPKSNQPKLYKQGETAHIGYTSYIVSKSWYTSTLNASNQFMNHKPDGIYLFVQITVRNDDKKARMIAPFKLIDDSGAEFETTDKSWEAENSIGILTDLNPGVQKSGVIVFDVSKKQNYKLELSGGFWSTDKALVKLNP